MIMGDQLKFQTIRRGAAVAAMTLGLMGVNATVHAAPREAAATTADAQVSKIGGGWLAERLINVRSIGTSCGKTPLAEASGRGAMMLRIDQTEAVSTTLSKHIDATKGAISVGVGWDVTKSRSITVSGSKEVPRGKYGTLKAYAKYSGKKFDVQGTTGGSWITFHTGKKAYKPIGVCFKYSQR